MVGSELDMGGGKVRAEWEPCADGEWISSLIIHLSRPFANKASSLVFHHLLTIMSLPPQRARSGTIPSMEISGDALRDNTIIVGAHPCLSLISILPLIRRVSSVFGASGDLAKKKVSCFPSNFTRTFLISISDVSRLVRSLS